jgi:predicted DNA-binding transcriptional regulator AlpA
MLPVAASVVLELGALAHVTPAESLLTIDQAARRLAVTRGWLYRSAKLLPFARKLSHRELRFDPAGLEAWLIEKSAKVGAR